MYILVPIIDEECTAQIRERCDCPIEVEKKGEGTIFLLQLVHLHVG